MSDYDERGLAMEAVRMLKLDERKRAFRIFQKHIGKVIWQSRQGSEIDLTPMFNELMEKTNE
jgi:nucleoside diphosphate kinase